MFNIDQSIAITIAVSDPDLDTTTTTAIDPPAFVTWTSPTFTNGSALVVANAGTHSIAMKVCDIWGLCTEESFDLTINQKPYLNAPIADTTCIQGHACTYTIPANTFLDDDNEVMTYTLVTAATPFSTFTAATRTLSAAAFVMNTVGTTPLTVKVCDKNNACV